MDIIIKRISNAISLVILFFVSAMFYFQYKGFAIIDGQVVLQKQEAVAAEKNGIATVLPQSESVSVSAKYAIGAENAPLTLYEYSSLGCPHCADFHLDIMPKLIKDYVKNGQLKVVFVHFPLDKKSMKAAMISYCMTYDNYFAFLDEMFDNQRSWWLDSDDERLFKYAAEFGLSYDETLACMNNDSVAREIVTNRQEAISRLKIQGTPSFLFSGPDGNEVIYGEPKYSALKEYLDKRLQNLQ